MKPHRVLVNHLMDLFKSIGKAMSFTTDNASSPQQQQQSQHQQQQLGDSSSPRSSASPSTGGGVVDKEKGKKKSFAAKLLENPFSALNPFDEARDKKSAKGGGRGGADSPPKSKSSSSSKKGLSSSSSSSAATQALTGAAGTTTVRKSSSRERKNSMVGGGAAAGGVRSIASTGAALEESERSRGAFGGDDDGDQMAASPQRGLSTAASKRRAAAAAAVGSTDAARSYAAFNKFEGEDGSPPQQQQPRKGVFGSVPSTDSVRGGTVKYGEEALGNFDDAKGGGANSSTASVPRGITSLAGTTRVKYQGTSVIQGNTIHFLITVVSVAAVGDVPASSSSSSDGGRRLALIGLLEPLGSVRASSKAIIERCDRIRRLERVKISPREQELSLVVAAATGGGGGSGEDMFLVDPASGPLLGVVIPYIRPVLGVSAVDGYRTEYWCACDASGSYRAPLYDVEGPIDDLNQAAVLRLRCHAMRREDLGAAGGGAVTSGEVSTQTVQEAKHLLQDDFDRELLTIKEEQRQELESAKREVVKLTHLLEWRSEELRELQREAKLKEEAMQEELYELRRQVQQKFSATQTSNRSTPLSPAQPPHTHTSGFQSTEEVADDGEKRSYHYSSVRAKAASDKPAASIISRDDDSEEGRMAAVAAAAAKSSTASSTPVKPFQLTREALESSSVTAALSPPKIERGQQQAHGSSSIDFLGSSNHVPPFQHQQPLPKTTGSAAAADAILRVREKLAQSERFLQQAKTVGVAATATSPVALYSPIGVVPPSQSFVMSPAASARRRV